jgi:ABC-type nitrate/sulfonate/bicarbonate transport system permease component
MTLGVPAAADQAETTDRPEAPVQERPESSGPAAWARDHSRAVLGFLGVALVLTSWELAAALSLVNPAFSSSPSRVAEALFTYITSPQFPQDMKVSGMEFGLGFAGALLIGVPVGIAIGWWRTVDALFDPILNFLYASPRIALSPLFIIWFGVGLTSKAMIVLIMAIFPIVINMSTAVRNTERQLVAVGRSFNATQLQLLRTIALPASLPSLVAGIRLGLGQALIGIFVAELTGASAGLGYTMNQAGQNFLVHLVFAALFVFATFGVVFTWLLRLVERRLSRWRVAG